MVTQAAPGGIRLRDYQTEAIEAVFKAWDSGVQRPAVVLPTGAGKTVVFSHLIKKWRELLDTDDPRMGRGARVMVLVHRDELADQAIKKISDSSPGLMVGKVKAAERHVHADVMVCSVQTLARGTALRQLNASQAVHGRIGLIITDECHHASAQSYRTTYDAFPDALNLGVTATMARGDGEGLGDVWEEVVFSRSILWMMSRKYLAPVRTRQVHVKELDMAGVKTSRGDYAAGDLGRAMLEAEADKAIPRAVKEHAEGRPGIVFTPTMATAEATAEALNSAGIRTAVVTGETPKEERHRIFDDFRHGRVQYLSNCMVLTEGFDAPWAEVAVIARPTKSAPLYTQMVGRVLRTWPGKKDALVLDLVGASANKIRTLIDLEPGLVKEIREGETLEEAVVREDEEGGSPAPDAPRAVAFDLKSKEVDMFAASETVWLRTYAGINFIAVGDTTVFLFKSLENPAALDVVTLIKGARTPVRHPVHRNLDPGMAMAWGEVVAEDMGAFPVVKSASWRKAKPSEKQVALAERLGVPGAAGMRRGDLSDALSVAFRSRSLDQYAPWA